MNERIVRIPVLPDTSRLEHLQRYGASAPELAASALGRAAELLVPGTSEGLGLRYAYDPRARRRQERLAAFVRLPLVRPNEAEDRRVLGGHLLSPFYQLESSSAESACAHMGSEVPNLFLVSAAEEIYEGEGGPYYTVLPLGRAGGGPELATVLDDLLDGLQAPCAIDIIARPRGRDDRLASAVVDELEDLSQKEYGISIERREQGGYADLARGRDRFARRSREILESTWDQMAGEDVNLSTFRVASLDRREGELVARSLGRSLAGASTCEISCLGPNDESFEEGLQKFRSFEMHIPSFEFEGGRCYSGCLTEDRLRKEWRNDRTRAIRRVRLSRLRHLVSRETLRSALRLPTSSGIRLKTIGVDTDPASPEDAIAEGMPPLRIGTQIDSGETLWIGRDELQKHAFISGKPGSGKTSTSLAILMQLWAEQRVPFLVLESAKAEYRQLLRAGGDWERDLRIWTPGNEGLSPCRINPLEVPSGCTVEEHVSLVESCFAAAVPMEGPIPSLIRRSLLSVFSSAGLDPDLRGEECSSMPMLRDLEKAARRVMDAQGYVGEVRRNIEGALATRLGFLGEGNVGRVFSTRTASPALKDLLRSPAIVELQGLNKGMPLFVLVFLTQLLRELRTMGPATSLRYVVLLEEAHNLVPAPGLSSRPGEADVAGEATRLFVRMLAELRAYGVGVIVADQSPSAVAPEVVKFANLQIAHLATERRDRETTADSILLGAEGALDLARLRPGEAYVFHGGLHRAIKVKVEQTVRTAGYLSDEELRHRLARQEWFQESTITRTADELDQLLLQVRRVLTANIELVRLAGSDGRPNALEACAAVGLAGTRLKRRLERLERDSPGEASRRLSAAYRRRFVELTQAASEAARQGTAEEPIGGGA